MAVGSVGRKSDSTHTHLKRRPTDLATFDEHGIKPWGTG
jgi:hypothetical protein